MSYPNGDVPTTDRVHPTPGCEMIVSLLIFALLWRLRAGNPPIKLFGMHLLLACGERYAVEFIRRSQHVVLGLIQPQLLTVATTVAGAALLAWPL